MPSLSQTDPIERRVVLMLKEERLRQGLSANQLAQNIGIDRTTITHLEADTGRPTLWVLLKIAEGLGMKLSAFIRSAERET